MVFDASLGFEKPSAIQQRAIKAIVKGRDVIAQYANFTSELELRHCLGRNLVLVRLPPFPLLRCNASILKFGTSYVIIQYEYILLSCVLFN